MKSLVGLLMLSPLDLGFSVLKESQEEMMRRIRAGQRMQQGMGRPGPTGAGVRPSITQAGGDQAAYQQSVAGTRGAKFGPEFRPTTEFEQPSPQMGGTTEDEEGRQINLGGLTPEQQRIQGMGEGYQGPNLLLMGPPEASGDHEGQIDEQFKNFVEQHGMPSSIHHHSMGETRHRKGSSERAMYNDGMKAHARRLSEQHGIPLVESGPRLHVPGNEDMKKINSLLDKHPDATSAAEYRQMLQGSKGARLKAIKDILGAEFPDYARRMTAGRLSMAMDGHENTGATTHSLVFGHAGADKGSMHRAIAEKEHQSGYMDGGDLIASPAGGERMYSRKMSPHDVDLERKREFAQRKRGARQPRAAGMEEIIDPATAQRMEDAKRKRQLRQQPTREETADEQAEREAGATGRTVELGAAKRPLRTSRMRGSQNPGFRREPRDLKSDNPMDRAWNALRGQALF